MVAKSAKSLTGRTIVVTRALEQSAELSAKLEEAGASVLQLPLIKIIPDGPEADVKDMFTDLWSYEWILFTSPNGVRHFFNLFFKAYDDIRALGGAHIAAIGAGTVAELRHYYIRADVVPKVASSEALGEALIKEQSLDNLNILIITGNKPNAELKLQLEAALAIVDCVQVYSTQNNDVSELPATAEFRKDGADAIIFASGSAAESFVAQAKTLKTSPNAKRPIACSIGAATSEVMKKLGIPVDVEAADASTDGIVKALLKHFSSK